MPSVCTFLVGLHRERHLARVQPSGVLSGSTRYLAHPEVPPRCAPSVVLFSENEYDEEPLHYHLRYITRGASIEAWG
jgi:hypothetical protein